MNSRTGQKMLMPLVVLLAMTATLQPSLGQDNGSPTVEYVVRAGDTLFGIARRFETTVDVLKKANSLSGDQIRVGQTLTIPSSGETPGEPDVPTDVSETPVVASPDDSTEADDIATPIDTIPDGVLPDAPSISADSVFLVPTAVADSVDRSGADPVDTDMDSELGFLDVQAGQSLYDIALTTGLSVDSLLALNPWVSTFLPDGATIGVPAEYASVGYTVKKGDTLFKIARDTGSSVGAIRAANRLDGDVINVGQVLVVPSTRVAMRPNAFEALPVIGSGEARVYSERFVGRLTAGGRPYNPDEFTISHSDLPIGSVVLVSSPDAGHRTFAEVTDRLPASAGYLIDVSQAVRNVFDEYAAGNLQVELRVVRYGPLAD